MGNKDKNVAATRERGRSALIDSAETSSFWEKEYENIKTGIASNKMVMISTVNTSTASDKGLLPNEMLNEKSR